VNNIKTYRKENSPSGRGLDSNGSGQGPVADNCEHNGESSGCMLHKGGGEEGFLDQLGDCASNGPHSMELVNSDKIVTSLETSEVTVRYSA